MHRFPSGPGVVWSADARRVISWGAFTDASSPMGPTVSHLLTAMGALFDACRTISAAR